MNITGGKPIRKKRRSRASSTRVGNVLRTAAVTLEKTSTELGAYFRNIARRKDRAVAPVDKEIHVILDNYCTHKRNDDWLAKYEGRVQFHFTPTSASWLNQIEIWFGLLTRKSLRGASFANKDQLRLAIEAFVARTNENPKPFHWRKREVKGSQLRNTIINLCN